MSGMISVAKPCLVLAGLLLGSVAPSMAFEVDSAAGAEQADSAIETPSQAVYEFDRRSRDGIGKFYFGREISQVMGHRGANWLERREREREERTDLLIEALPLSADSVVADIGAGTGYFSFPIAQRVPNGRVLAVDIQPQMLEIVTKRSENDGVGNVETVLGSEIDPRLPDAAVDVILLVDAYHEFSYPAEMGQAMADALKPGGVLVLIEYRGEDPSVPIKPLHKMTQSQARLEMAAIGLEWQRTEDFLPQQHFMVFVKPELEPLQGNASGVVSEEEP